MTSVFPSNIRTGILVSALALIAVPCLIAPASAAEIVVIANSGIRPYRDAVAGFRNTCSCSIREMQDTDADIPGKIEALHPAAVFAVGATAFEKAAAVRNVPVLYAMVMPSQTAKHRAENISGVSMDISPEEYFATMMLLFPGAKNIGLVFDPDETGPYVERAEAEARRKGLTLIAKSTSAAAPSRAELSSLMDKIDIFWMLPDSVIANAAAFDELLLLSFQKDVPVITFSKKYTDAGAAAALVIEPRELGAQAGEMAQRLLSGREKTSHAYARKPHLIENEKILKKMGLRGKASRERSPEKAE
jgi:putative ABC transport system substrate-binding protein